MPTPPPVTMAILSFSSIRLSSLSGYRPVIRCSRLGSRAPCTVMLEATLSISRRSSDVSSMAAAPMFSSRRSSFLVPGIGATQGFWARSHASAIWAGVAFFRSAIVRSSSIKAWFALRAIRNEADSEFLDACGTEPRVRAYSENGKRRSAGEISWMSAGEDRIGSEAAHDMIIVRGHGVVAALAGFALPAGAAPGPGNSVAAPEGFRTVAPGTLDGPPPAAGKEPDATWTLHRA